ncbi:MAG: HTH domain-containing protein [Caldilineaceae bacterium]
MNGPRFVIIFLKVDSIDLPKSTEAALLAATGVATGLVLTGGGAYIAHALADSKARGMLRWFMVLCWFLLLIFSVVLLSPLMVAAIDDSSLKSVLSSKFSQWLWSVTSVLAVEVIAGGAMVAYAQYGRTDDPTETTVGTPDVLSVLTGALARRIERSVAPYPETSSQSPVAAGASQETETFNPSDVATDVPVVALTQLPEHVHAVEDIAETKEQSPSDEENRKYTKQERQQLLLEELQSMGNEADIQVDVLASKLRVSSQTVYRDLSDLKLQNRLQIEDGSLTVTL